MIIVDTDVLVYYLIEGERTAQAHRLKKWDADWRAPALWRSEFVSVINKYVKARIYDLKRAGQVLNLAELTYGNIDMKVDMQSVLNLAVNTGASTYDAHFLALAQSSGRPLITGEK